MMRALCFLGILIAAPLVTAASEFPNKPGKKPEARLVFGAQARTVTKPSQNVVVGAGADARRGPSGGGDFGLVAPAPLKQMAPQRSVGYEPSSRAGNKRPSS